VEIRVFVVRTGEAGRRGAKGKVVFAVECSCLNHDGQDERIFRIKDGQYPVHPENPGYPDSDESARAGYLSTSCGLGAPE